MPKSKGLLLINLGTPDSPEPKDVGRYLAEFLMDRHVVDIPYLARLALVRGIIVPFRRFKSSAAYKTIWSDRGSPLRYHLSDLCDGVRRELAGSMRVEGAMRYGAPSIEAALNAFRKDGTQELIIAPLYPQYATSTSLSTEEKVANLLAKFKTQFGYDPKIKFVQPFFSHPAWLQATVDVALKMIGDVRETDHFLFTYHGIPERHLTRIDETQSHCLKAPNCCESPNRLRTCYRAQCVHVSKNLAAKLKLRPDQWTYSFQSRLGRTPWIQPFTDQVIPKLAKSSNQNSRLILLTPSFVADCLETLEELGDRARHDFKLHSKAEFVLVPCLNASTEWISALKQIVLDAELETEGAAGVVSVR